MPLEEIQKLGERLSTFYDRFRPYLLTRTRNTSEYGLRYLSGLLRMETKRNFANISRQTEMNGQNLQHFISNSPWSARELIRAVQNEIKLHPAFAQAILVLDESADEKAGEHSAGAGLQHNGRLGTVAMSQVGVFLSLVTPQVNTWIDGELYLPAHWFDEAHREQRQAVGFPEDIPFHTKPELGWSMIQRAKRRGIPFQAVVMDEVYGGKAELRRDLERARIEYYADVPADTHVFLQVPDYTYPLTAWGRPSQVAHIGGVPSYEVRAVARQETLEWKTISLRPDERGHLQADFARVRVWTIVGEEVRHEWLLLRKDKERITYSLSNAPEEASLEQMAWRKSHRYWIEPSNQDAKGELGWDEFQARKYRAWEHQLALTILAAWFIADTRLDWMQRFARDPALLAHYEVDVLPQLSISNVRELLRAAMPLPQLSPQDAAQLVTDHLVNRTRSRKSRLRKHLGHKDK